MEFPIESLGDDGVDTLSVRRAVTEILGDEQAPERLIVRLSEWVVREINACMIQDPPEPATPKLKDELLGEYVDNEDVMGYHLDDGLPLKIEAYFDPNNTHDIRHKYAEIDAIVREIDRLDKRNNLIASLWSLPIDELHEDSGLQMEEEEWLDKIDADGEVRFFGPNYYEEESEIEEEYDLPMSVSEKFFKNKLPHYFNDRLLPHAYIADISDTSTHIQIMRKIFMRKSLIYLYAQNNPPR